MVAKSLILQHCERSELQLRNYLLKINIEIVKNWRINKKWLDGAYKTCFRFCRFSAIFFMKCFEIPISLSKLNLIFPNVARFMQKWDFFTDFQTLWVKRKLTWSSWESGSMVGVVEGLTDAWVVPWLSGTDDGLEERLMAPPAVELTPSSLVLSFDTTEASCCCCCSNCCCCIMRVN